MLKFNDVNQYIENFMQDKSHAFGYEGTCKPLDRTRFTWEGSLIEFGDIEKGKARLLIERGSYPFTRVGEK